MVAAGKWERLAERIAGPLHEGQQGQPPDTVSILGNYFLHRGTLYIQYTEMLLDSWRVVFMPGAEEDGMWTGLMLGLRL